MAVPREVCFKLSCYTFVCGKRGAYAAVVCSCFILFCLSWEQLLHHWHKESQSRREPGGRWQEILWHPDDNPLAPPVLAQCPLHRHRSLLAHANESTWQSWEAGTSVLLPERKKRNKEESICCCLVWQFSVYKASFGIPHPCFQGPGDFQLGRTLENLSHRGSQSLTAANQLFSAKDPNLFNFSLFHSLLLF